MHVTVLNVTTGPLKSLGISFLQNKTGLLTNRRISKIILLLLCQLLVFLEKKFFFDNDLEQ